MKHTTSMSIQHHAMEAHKKNTMKLEEIANAIVASVAFVFVVAQFWVVTGPV